MKTIFITIMASMVCLLANAQMPSMLEDRPEWLYSYGFDWNKEEDEAILPFLYRSYLRIYVDGEEELNGKVYKKLYSDFLKQNYYGDIIDEYSHKYCCGLREDANAVYSDYADFIANIQIDKSYNVFIPNEDKELVIYDFTFKKGDNIEAQGDDKRLVEIHPYVEIEDCGYTATFGGEQRYFYSVYGEKIIAGVGSTMNQVYYPIGSPAVSVSPNAIHLDLYVQNGKVIYKAPNNIFRPSPFYDLSSSIKSVANERATTIYDLTGRRLNSVPKSGMYIQGGKVKVAR